MADIKDAIEDVVDKAERASDRLNHVIAALVAVLATMMALFNVKDGNIVQAMAQAQARTVDSWTYFQAKSTKQFTPPSRRSINSPSSASGVPR
jgi:2-methylcitrate dehydratase PrpD